MNEPVPTRKVTWRGECLHCGKRQKVNKGTKKIGSHFLGGGDSYCPGVDLAPVYGSVREYIAKPKVEITYTAPSGRARTVYKWAIVAAITVVALAAVVIVSYYAGEAIT